MFNNKFVDLDRYQTVTTENLKKVVGGRGINIDIGGDLYTHLRDLIFGFTDGLAGLRRHRHSWRYRD